jgi:hypothetical protein
MPDVENRAMRIAEEVKRRNLFISDGVEVSMIQTDHH